MSDFKNDDIFLVTGASSGIGQSVALKLNELGASVIAVGRNLERLELTKSMAKNENIFIEQKDLTLNIESLPSWVKNIKEKYGKLKGLVCCAGVDCPMPLQIVEIEKIHEVFNINYLVPIFLSKGFSDKRNHTDNASITFIASTAGVNPERGQAVYAASKAALIASMRSISKELANKGVRVNSISPAFVDTPMYQKNLDAIGTNIDEYPLGIGKPSDIADMVIYLSSNKARWITGQNYILDGGYI